MGEDPGAGAVRRPAPEGPLEHAELLQEVASGSEEALVELYRAFEGRIFAFAQSRMNDPAFAADLVNEVMVEVWKKASTFQGRSAVSSWILGIARNRLMDEVRRRGRRHFDELDERTPDDDSVDASEVMAAADDASQVEECMGRLNEAQREAVHLAFYEDLSYGEIAEIAGCPEGTVKTRIHHAKKALQRCLQGFGLGPRHA